MIELDPLRYEQPAMLARYLEAEFGDLLFGEEEDDQLRSGLFSRSDRTVPFYKKVAYELANFIPNGQGVLDVGAGLARLALELRTLRPDLSVSTFDTSENFTRIVRSMTGEAPALPNEVPVIEHNAEGVSRVELSNQLRQVAERFRSAKILPLRERSDLKSQYGVVLCCNVVDRVEDPIEFSKWLSSLVKMGGLLAIATPYDYDAEAPVKIMDVEELLPKHAKILHDVDVDYVFRLSPRKLVSYKSHLVIARCKPASR